ncbi:Glutathione S-transferase [Pseudomonas orientalis]|nr:Glutathione S-transferase [Pseudomonas orientalis]
MVKLPVPAECEALHAWHARINERASVKAWRAMVQEGDLQN